MLNRLFRLFRLIRPDQGLSGFSGAFQGGISGRSLITQLPDHIEAASYYEVSSGV